MVRGVGVVAALVGCLSLQACGTMLYSETRDGQGKAAKEAWGKVDLAGQTSIARQNLAQLQSLRQATISQNELFQREALALSLGKASDETIRDVFANTQQMLQVGQAGVDCARRILAPVSATGGKPEYCSFGDLQKQWSAVMDGRGGLRPLNAVWDAKARAIEREFGSPLPTCTHWLDPAKKLEAAWTKKANGDARLLSLLTPPVGDSVTGLCTKIATQEQARSNLISATMSKSALAAAITRYGKLRDDLAALKVKAADSKQPVDAAKVEVAKQQAADDGEGSNLAAVKRASANLATAVDGLAKVAAQFPDNDYLKNALAEIKQESLNDFLKSIKDAKPGEAPPADTGKAAAAVILFADYFDQTSKRFKASADYGLAAMVLERKLAELEQARVQRAIAVNEQRVDLAKRTMQVLELQLESYLTADAYATQAIDAAGPRMFRTFMLGNTAADLQTRERVAAAIVGLSEGGITYASELDRLKAQENALERLNALTASEMSLQAWNTLIGSNVDQLAVWAGTGIKQEQISQLINNLAAVFIAYGVNK